MECPEPACPKVGQEQMFVKYELGVRQGIR
jgi:hypothetical protein